MAYDGGPAFPTTDTIVHVGDKGMSLRDYFAAQALIGQIHFEGMEGCNKETIAGMAYELADAMLVERQK